MDSSVSTSMSDSFSGDVKAGAEAPGVVYKRVLQFSVKLSERSPSSTELKLNDFSNCLEDVSDDVAAEHR